MAEKWVLPTLSEVLASTEAINRTVDSSDNVVVPDVWETAVVENNQKRANGRILRDRLKAEREWCGAIAAIEELLLQNIGSGKEKKGLILAAPVPLFSHPSLLSSFESAIFTAGQFNLLALMPFQLPPAHHEEHLGNTPAYHSLPLIPADPLTAEQFCVVFTNSFSLVMVLGEDLQGLPAFLFSFDPEVVQQSWTALRSRLLLTNLNHSLLQLDTLVKRFPPQSPDYRTVMQFSRLLLKHLPEETKLTEEPKCRVAEEQAIESEFLNLKSANIGARNAIANPKSDDVELLQALTHEIRTPLTTIRTLTRLILKRQDLAPDIIKRLEIIDQECTEQINRMELIFQAVELETSEQKQSPVYLTAISLSQVLQQSIPHWKKQAIRRNLTLDVVLPQKLPTVVTNPAMLDQVLTGLIENFTRNIPSGGHIQVEVTPAGNQLKLQLQSQPHPDEVNKTQSTQKQVKSIGQLLMFQPETGSLSLNMNVTKNLFQALGGKLIVRQRPQQGEVMTIFLPLH